MNTDEKTPAETPVSILKEIKTLEKITVNVADRALEIQGDIKLIFTRLDRLDNRIAFTFGLSCAAFVVALVSILR